MKTQRTIKIDSREYPVLNAYSSGPGAPKHTYDIPGGYVYGIAGVWKLQRPGQYPQTVTVEAEDMI
jgi:hypothetical protein